MFYLEEAARVWDLGSTFYKLSALVGGIAYIEGDGSYLLIEKPASIQRIYAYYGGIVYANDGATA